MSISAIRHTITRLYQEGWGKGNLDVVDEVFASEHILHWNELSPTDQHRTTEEVKQIISNYRTAFPDLIVVVDDIVVEAERAAVQVTFIGTHTGVYEGFAPTNKKSRFTDMQILRIHNGKITESSLGSGGLPYFFSILDGSAFR